jgi:hypothetical protein
MNLYIQIKDGQPINHPIIETNMIQAYPDVDLINLPPEFARFNRYQMPTDLVTSPFQMPYNSYGLDADGVSYCDIWAVRDMDAGERQVRTRVEQRSVDDEVKFFKDFAADKIANTTGDVQTAWQNYLDSVNSMDTSDPFSVVWPAVPQVDSEGYLIVT